VLCTPAHYLGRWDDRLAIRRAEEAMLDLVRAGGADSSTPSLPDGLEADNEATTTEPRSEPTLGAPGTQEQFDFGF
jgi:hypothetical protein